MPKREIISIPTSGATDPSPLRAALVRPDPAPAAVAPVVVMHRGVAFNDNDVDFLDQLGEALAAAGIITLHFEPRAMGLILHDFHDFTLEQAVADLQTVMEHARSLGGVDTSRIGLLAWCFGATAAVEAVRLSKAVSRLCLLNPASPAFIVARAEKAATLTPPVETELYPRAMIERLTQIVESKQRLSMAAPTLIVHAAADRVVPASASDEFMDQSQSGSDGRWTERLLIARANHSFTHPETKAVCIERVVSWFSAMSPVVSSSSAAGTAA